MKRITIIILAVVFFIGALGLTCYPLISNYVNTRYASEIHTAYEEVIHQTDNSDLLKAKELAIAYNDAIRPGAAEETYSQAALLQASEDYASQLNMGGDGIMGYVTIPKIRVNLPIYHGTGADSLERGIGHLLGSSLPIGGKDTHSILTAHSGMATQKMFSDLSQLAEGDVFYLNVLGETLAYQVNDIHTVLPYDTTYLGIEQDKDLCTLVTCTPFGINTHRLLVRGFRIPYEEAEVIEEITVQEEVTSTWEQQYVKGLLIGLGVVLLIVIIVLAIWLVRRYRYERR